jgi:hypothetical protein
MKLLLLDRLEVALVDMIRAVSAQVEVLEPESDEALDRLLPEAAKPGRFRLLNLAILSSLIYSRVCRQR